MDDIIKAALESVTDDGERMDLYMQLIDIFQDNDCDTLYECVDDCSDPMFKDAYEAMHPEEDALIEDTDLDDWDDQSNGSF